LLPTLFEKPKRLGPVQIPGFGSGDYLSYCTARREHDHLVHL
jgi:hypothetical protein